MRHFLLVLSALLLQNSQAFVAPNGNSISPASAAFTNVRRTNHVTVFSESTATTTEGEEATAAAATTTDPKEAVKLFGRLAEKYIMLDASGGMCCYSACTDCEFRDPNGGYIMADQSASRPKWIPTYEHRFFESSGKEHTTKWSTEIFTDGPAVTKEEFIKAVMELKFAPPLGGPYMSASAAGIEDETAVGYLFDVLAGEKEKLTKHRMSTRMKELSEGEEGLTWPLFSKAMNVE